MRKRRFFVCGCGTGVGKTIVSAALVQGFAADYWKPVQSGIEEGTDSQVIGKLATKHGIIHPEAYRLKDPLSPHAAAENQGISISLDKIVEPKTENHLIIEGAGGLLVPLNYRHTVIDLIESLVIPVILVSDGYLGTINHTLLSIEALRSRQIKIEGLVFNREFPAQSEKAITELSGISKTVRVPKETELSANSIDAVGARLVEWLT